MVASCSLDVYKSLLEQVIVVDRLDQGTISCG